MEKYSCGLPFLCRRVERKNMPADYAKNGSPGKRVGLHYRHFEGLFEGRCLQTQRIAHRRFFKRYPNPRSRARLLQTAKLTNADREGRRCVSRRHYCAVESKWERVGPGIGVVE